MRPPEELVLHELAGRVRQEDLAAVSGRPDPRGTVHAEADVALAGRPRLARVEPHAHPDLVALGPRVARERS